MKAASRRRAAPGRCRRLGSLTRRLWCGIWAGVLALGGTVPTARGDVATVRFAVDPIPGRSGVLERLLPTFEAAQGVRVAVEVAASSKEALEIGAAGRADAVLVRAPRQEVQYVNQGFYLDRRPVMRLEYVLAGPPSDAARVRGSRRPVVAFRRIAERQAPFVSHEGAGSRLFEEELWKQAGVVPRPPWYTQAAGGLEDVLALAAAGSAYVLVDRAHVERLPAGALVVVLEGVGALRSDFHYLEVNPHRFPRARYAEARALGDYLVSALAQEAIRGFGAAGGAPAFTPAGPRDN
jgi:tungstate transport system substrate-binding protein